MRLVAISNLARERASQVSISRNDIIFVMTYGRTIHSGDAIHYYLGKRDIPDGHRSDDRLAKLEGTTLTVSRNGILITLYKNKMGSKRLRKKSKWHRKLGEAA